MFFSGSSVIPPLGLETGLLNFDGESPYPLASVCGTTLTLPTKYSVYNDFKENVIYGLKHHGGYGLF